MTPCRTTTSALPSAKKGQIDEAIRQYREALRLKPDLTPARITLTNFSPGKASWTRPIRQFQEAVRLKPDDAESHYKPGERAAYQRPTGPAIGQYQEAIRLKPDYADPTTTSATLHREGQIDEAINPIPGNPEAPA